MKKGSLKTVVYDCLAKHSLSCAQAWNEKVVDLKGVDMNDQLSAVNSFWRLQLGQLQANTIPQRECLQDEMSVDSWLANFERYVVPVIVKHKLPL